MQRDVGSHDTSLTKTGQTSGQSSVYADVTTSGSGMAMQGISKAITGGTGVRSHAGMGVGLRAGIEKEEEG